MKIYYFSQFMFSYVKKAIKYAVINNKWRKKNKDNETFLTERTSYCIVDRIDVGRKTYGKINAISFGNTESFLRIGNFCSIAPDVLFLLDGGHNYKSFSTYPFRVKYYGEKIEATTKGPIVVEDDVWIGQNSLILSGVKIGQGAVIGAGSIVSKDIPPYAIYAGGRIIKYRFDNETIEKLLKFDYSKLSDEIILNNRDFFINNLSNSFVNDISYKSFFK